MNPTSVLRPLPARIAGIAGLALLTLGLAACARHEPGTYATPEKAVAAMIDLVGKGDDSRTEAVFGPGSAELFRSGDAEADRAMALEVKALAEEKVGFEELDADTRVANFGNREWPFPIPLVRAGERWRFDLEAGRQELLNRRIGYFELATLTSLHEYVDAQREYAAEGRDGQPRAFAQRFLSSEGKRDGLYWTQAEGEEPSPLGDLLAGSAPESTASPPQAFQGYHYRILTSQGPSAPGGARSYLDAAGLMRTGFAAIAWPAKHGNSGVMTFVVSHRGVVYQKDLGEETETAVAGIQAFDPDSTWEPTHDSLDEVAHEIEGGAEEPEAGAAEEGTGAAPG